MTGKDAIRTSLESTAYLLTFGLADFTDADLLVRPAPNSNHAAWQLGHLISSEAGIVKGQIPDAKYPELPAGFKEAHAMDKTGSDAGFFTKAEYLALFEKTRAATLAALAALTDADLDKVATGRMAPMAPTLGAQFILVANHTLMHGSQFSVTRRKLGKPVLY